MNENIDEALLSQLVDGELTSDRQNEVLAAVLDDAEACEKLKTHLRLRRLTDDWRRQEPTGVVTLTHVSAAPRAEASWARRLAPLAAAAVIGATLVTGGFLLARHGKQFTGTGESVLVTRAERRQIAEVFRFHELAAGPLRWYAADDGNVLLGSAVETEAVGKPVAVLLRLASAAADAVPAKTYVIVCRDSQSANIELPESEGTGAPVRLFLMPAARQGVIQMQYAITQEGPPGAAAVVGQRRVGLAPARLGQLALGDRLVNVEAAAWVIPEETP
ncbi:MAG: hypothetical protein AMS16_03535 [Planctomycetes bacterium DG_58]|nr:MAG: hypothetical protein AMS16_03535 [Planctomycetes bacterium DG_58]